MGAFESGNRRSRDSTNKTCHLHHLIAISKALYPSVAPYLERAEVQLVRTSPLPKMSQVGMMYCTQYKYTSITGANLKFNLQNDTVQSEQVLLKGCERGLGVLANSLHPIGYWYLRSSYNIRYAPPYRSARRAFLSVSFVRGMQLI